MQSASPQVIPLPGAAEGGRFPYPMRSGSPGYSPKSNMESVDNLEITNILLLDDDTELADTLKQLLEARNFIVTLAKNGVEGLRETMAMDFDVIICDLMMPTMPGDMFYLAVQKTKPHLCSRFLFVTGHGDDPRTKEFLQSTDGLTIFKPVPSEELVQMISLVIQRNSR
jgi:DNA-binding response OmpR family regulator